jgi:mycothione reductase
MARHFDLAILGTGSGNAIPTREMEDWSIAVVEPDVFGGTCLNRGCIPSKMFVHAADVARAVRTAGTFGVRATFEGADLAAIRDRVFGRIDPIAAGGEAYRRSLPNVTVFDQPARFTGPRRIAVGEEEITADRVVLAVGTRPYIPPIPGIEGVAHHTSDTVMRLDELPGHMVVVGGGAVASEMAHVFSALGSRVTVLLRGDRLLSHEEPEAGERLTSAFRERGIDVRARARITWVRQRGPTVVVGLDGEADLDADVLLLAVGRVSNADRMDLHLAGIDADAHHKVHVDEHLRTSAEGVWALGDVESHHQDLKHVANAHAKAIRHSLLHPDDPAAPVLPTQPRATFADPEVASVGMLEAEARALGHDVAVGRREYAATAYGWALEDEGSFAKVVVDRPTGLLLGACVVGPMASILIQPLVQAMTFGQTAAQVAEQVVWPHPALTEVVEQVLLDAAVR